MRFREEEIEVLKALAHPVRLQIVAGLLEGECNVAKIQKKYNLPQSTTSQHLGVLKSKGIVKGKRKGVKVCYRVVNKKAGKIIKLLKQK